MLRQAACGAGVDDSAILDMYAQVALTRHVGTGLGGPPTRPPARARDVTPPPTHTHSLTPQGLDMTGQGDSVSKEVVCVNGRERGGGGN